MYACLYECLFLSPSQGKTHWMITFEKIKENGMEIYRFLPRKLLTFSRIKWDFKSD